MSFGASDFSQTSKQANPHKVVSLWGFLFVGNSHRTKNILFRTLTHNAPTHIRAYTYAPIRTL